MVASILSEKRLVFILAALSAITPLAIDMYIPAISNMSRDLNVDESMVSVSISIFFLGLALGQLFGGPISDAYGRKPIVVTGLSIFCISSFAIIFADSVYWIWVLRFIQAFGGGVATVNVSATVKDMFSGKDSARIFSMIGSITILAPLVAPVIGLILISIFKRWETIFAVLGIYSLLAIYFYGKNIQISTTKERMKISLIGNYFKILKTLKPMLMIASLVISSSGLYAILTFSSVMYEKYLGLPKSLFIFCFSMNVTCLIIASRINMHLVRRVPPSKLLTFGISMQVVISIALFVSQNTLNPYIIAPLIAMLIGTLGFVFGNAVSIILDFFPKISGSASAMIGVLQYGIGALVGFLVGLFDNGTLLSLMCAILFSSICGAIILTIAMRCNRKLTCQ